MLHEYSLPLLVFFGVLSLGYYLTSRIQTHVRLRKLGAQPPTVPYRYPFGFDMLFEAIQVMSICKASNELVSSETTDIRFGPTQYFKDRCLYLQGILSEKPC